MLIHFSFPLAKFHCCVAHFSPNNCIPSPSSQRRRFAFKKDNINNTSMSIDK